MATANVTGLGYLGNRISFRDMEFFDLCRNSPLEVFSEYRSGIVVAVQVPETTSGIEVLLLVRDTTTQKDQYFRLDRIEIDEVCSL
jgi:phosphosulfolactate phosphohydrolase-like enzyme